MRRHWTHSQDLGRHDPAVASNARGSTFAALPWAPMPGGPPSPGCPGGHVPGVHLRRAAVASNAQEPWRPTPRKWARRQPASEPSDVEPEGAQLVATLVGDLVRAPRRKPHPVDPDVADQTAARARAQRLS